MDSSSKEIKELSNDEIINNILGYTNTLIEDYCKETEFDMNEIYESFKFYLEKF